MVKRTSNWIAAFALVIILFFLELTIFNTLRLRGSRPELLLVATVFFGFHFGMIRGVEMGILSGILKDVFSTAEFGINTCLFVLIGLLAGFLRNKLVKENFLTEFLLSATSVYLVSGLYFLYLDRVTGSEMDSALWEFVFFKAFYTGLLAPVLFFVCTRIFGPKAA